MERNPLKQYWETINLIHEMGNESYHLEYT